MPDAPLPPETAAPAAPAPHHEHEPQGMTSRMDIDLRHQAAAPQAAA